MLIILLNNYGIFYPNNYLYCTNQRFFAEKKAWKNFVPQRLQKRKDGNLKCERPIFMKRKKRTRELSGHGTIIELHNRSSLLHDDETNASQRVCAKSAVFSAFSSETTRQTRQRYNRCYIQDVPKFMTKNNRKVGEKFSKNIICVQYFISSSSFWVKVLKPTSHIILFKLHLNTLFMSREYVNY